MAATPRHWRGGARRFTLPNTVLLAGSIVFLAWGAGPFMPWIAGAVVFNYVLALAIGWARRAAAVDRIRPLARHCRRLDHVDPHSRIDERRLQLAAVHEHPAFSDGTRRAPPSGLNVQVVALFGQPGDGRPQGAPLRKRRGVRGGAVVNNRGTERRGRQRWRIGAARSSTSEDRGGAVVNVGGSGRRGRQRRGVRGGAVVTPGAASPRDHPPDPVGATLVVALFACVS